MLKQSGKHILTVHLEDYFQLGPLSRSIPLRHWPRFEKRAEKNTARALDILDRYGHKATFFTLGWIADEMPDVVAEITRRGHEVASKGYYHRAIGQMTPEEFRADAVRSRIALENACGQSVKGYRIARGWFSPDDLWALDILASEGFAYDSSLRPLAFNLLGRPDLRFVSKHETGHGAIWELPLSSWNLFGFSLPISGGNYVRQLPNGFVRRRISQWDRRQQAPLVFYFHVWELDPCLPRINDVRLLERIRQYRNLECMQERLEYYLGRYAFVSAAGFLQTPLKPVDPRPKPIVEDHLTVVAHTGMRQPVTVVVPCYNEEPILKYLANTLSRFKEKHRQVYDFRFVFIDDGSSDETWKLLNELFGKWDFANLVRHEQNCGVASACMTGLKSAETDIVCVIDCDCTYEPEQLIKMIPLLESGVDMVTASPYHQDGSVINVPGWRLLLSQGLSSLYRLVLGHKFRTYTACFRVYCRDSVKDLELDNEDFLGIAEIFARLDLQGAKIVEFPAVLESRIMGQSSLKTLRTIRGHLRLLYGLVVRKYFRDSAGIQRNLTRLQRSDP